MNLHLNSDAFKELVELSSNHFGYQQSHVEKDYWVSKILKELAVSEFSEMTNFKGLCVAIHKPHYGTLSKKDTALIFRQYPLM